MNEFVEAQNELAGPGTTGWWERAVLTDEQRAQLHEAAADPSITDRAISIVLVRWGVDVNAGRVGYWRRNHAR